MNHNTGQKPPEIPKLIPPIPLPFDEVVSDVLKVKPPNKALKSKISPTTRADAAQPENAPKKTA